MSQASAFNALLLYRLILIAEKDTVYKKFPTPLINRLEKHFVLTSSVLESWQHSALREFKNWIQAFSKTRYRELLYTYLHPPPIMPLPPPSTCSDSRGNQFKEAHAFIGYQNDTPAAVIFQATNMLKRLVDRPGEQECYRLQRAGILGDDLDYLSVVNEESPQWTQAVGLLIAPYSPMLFLNYLLLEYSLFHTHAHTHTHTHTQMCVCAHTFV